MYFYKEPAQVALSLSFPSSQRLKSRKLIQQLYQQGATIHEYPVKAVWQCTELPEPVFLQVGFGVSKRIFPNAVDRNRIKRLLREAVRLEQHRIKPFLDNEGLQVAVMLMYTSKELKSLNSLQPKIILILARLQHALEGDKEKS